jgi:hypothetical protein
MVIIATVTVAAAPGVALGGLSVGRAAPAGVLALPATLAALDVDAAARVHRTSGARRSRRRGAAGMNAAARTTTATAALTLAAIAATTATVMLATAAAMLAAPAAAAVVVLTAAALVHRLGERAGAAEQRKRKARRHHTLHHRFRSLHRSLWAVVMRQSTTSFVRTDRDWPDRASLILAPNTQPGWLNRT